MQREAGVLRTAGMLKCVCTGCPRHSLLALVVCRCHHPTAVASLETTKCLMFLEPGQALLWGQQGQCLIKCNSFYPFLNMCLWHWLLSCSVAKIKTKPRMSRQIINYSQAKGMVKLLCLYTGCSISCMRFLKVDHTRKSSGATAQQGWSRTQVSKFLSTPHTPPLRMLLLLYLNLRVKSEIWWFWNSCYCSGCPWPW